MTASRNTILALGLIALALAADNTALGASFIGSSSGGGCEATCDGGCQVGCEASCEGGCGGCQSGCDIYRAENFNHESDCRYCNKCSDMAGDPIFGQYAPYFKEISDCCEGCSVRTEASVLLLHRATPGTTTVLLDPNSGTGLFDASRFEFPYSAGPRVSLIVTDCEGWGFEWNYFQVDGWAASANIANGSMPSGFANLIVDNANQLALTDAHFEAVARMYSAESNVRKLLFGKVTGIAGFRWMELMDRYFAEGTSATTANIANETVTTHNHLYGFQIGADGEFGREEGRWRLNGFVKAGVFGNDATQATFLNDAGGLGSRAVNNNQLTTSFFGEAGLVGYFHISKHVAASGGYQVMFINGVAQPANQLAGTSLANSTASLDVNSGLFYHGATVGLEVNW